MKRLFKLLYVFFLSFWLVPPVSSQEQPSVAMIGVPEEAAGYWSVARAFGPGMGHRQYLS